MKYALTEVLPHRYPMILLNEIQSIDENRTVAKVIISERSHFLQQGKIPAWVGIEYMAQTMAAYGGYKGQQSGSGKAPIGFLLGARGYKSLRTHFTIGEELEIEAIPVFIETEVSSFRCRIRIQGQEVATATITAYKPSVEFMEQLKAEI